MKKNLSNSTGILFALILFLSVSCARTDQHAGSDTYTCPMHPTVVADKPGVCPVCGMNLERRLKNGEEAEITEMVNPLLASPNGAVASSAQVIRGEYKSMPIAMAAEGIVTYDPRFLYTIPARIGGRLERVFLKYPFQRVYKGQKVAEIYSPELLTAQRELLFLVENDRDNKDLIEAAKNKLLLLGATPAQVDDIIRKRAATYTFSLYSLHDGYIMNEGQKAPALSPSVSNSTSDKPMGMTGTGSVTGSAAQTMNTTPVAFQREGNYVTAGQTMFKIIDLAAIRVELDLPSVQADAINLQDEVLLDFGNGLPEKAKIDFVQPFFTAGQNFVKIRVYMPKDKTMQIGQLVRATVQLGSVEALWLPNEAVLDMGLEKVVFTMKQEVFRPTKVVTGTQTNGWIEIKQGLSSSDQVAHNAQYLVDSESFVKPLN